MDWLCKPTLTICYSLCHQPKKTHPVVTPNFQTPHVVQICIIDQEFVKITKQTMEKSQIDEQEKAKIVFLKYFGKTNRSKQIKIFLTIFLTEISLIFENMFFLSVEGTFYNVQNHDKNHECNLYLMQTYVFFLDFTFPKFQNIS